MSALFPEIDGLEDEAPSSLETFDDAWVAAPAARDAIGRLLGLTGSLGAIRVTQAHLDRTERHLRLRVEHAAFGEVTLIFSAGRVAGAVRSGPHLSLRHSGKELIGRRAQIFQRIAARLTDLSMDRLIACLRQHGAAWRAAASAGGEVESSFAYSYASSVLWRTFFEGRETYRGYKGGLRGRVATVHHSDDECEISTPPTGDGTMSFFNFPRYVDPPQDPARSAIYLSTNVGDLDVIKGGDRKLEEVLDRVGEAKGSFDAVFVMPTCISLVTGDDTGGAAARLERKLEVPVIDLGNAVHPYAELVRQLRQRPDFARAERRPHHYNLIGMPRMPGHEDLLRLLDESGARRASWMLPELDLASLAEHHAACVQVMYPCAWQAQAYEALLEGVDIPRLTPPPPFGIEGSTRWLRAIAEALGLEAEMERALEARLPRLTQGWDELRREASELRLGFVVDDEGLTRLKDPALTLGIPIVLLAREMGFSLDILRWAAPGTQHADQNDGAVRVSWFGTPAELEERLRASQALAFYSDISQDRRLTRLGKNVFSLRDVDMGPAGAVRTLKRLLAICRLPFYRKYSRHLGSAFSASTRERAS